MRQYEVTFIVDPVLSAEEIKSTATTYVDHLKSEGCTIVNVDEMGLMQLAYPIKKRSSGIYFCVEFQSETGALIPKMELAFRRDERIMRFLTVSLNKYGVKYNDDKRNGLIGSKKKKDDKEDDKKSTSSKAAPAKAAPAKAAPAKAAPVVAAAAVAETAAPAAVKEEEE
jgi:small subunit ribosomal protein S6